MTINGFNTNGQPVKSFSSQKSAGGNLENNSGQGKDSPVLDIVAKRFNWGAFGFSWIWGLCNKTYITLIIFPLALICWIPIIGSLIFLGVCIWFGIKGNKWAWQNKRWNSVEHFHRVQKNWAIAEIVMACIGIIYLTVMAAFVFPALLTNTDSVRNTAMADKEISVVSQAATMQEAMEEKCDYTSNGLAAYFASQMNTDYSSGNSFKAADGSEWSFTGDGACSAPNACIAEVRVSDSAEPVIIPLYAKQGGYIEVHEK